MKRMLKISPNISKSQLIIALEEAGAQGVVINASELDMLTNAMKQDCGKHDDVLRAAFHHEEASSYYKTDKRMVVAHVPHLALCLTGTPSQLHRFNFVVGERYVTVVWLFITVEGTVEMDFGSSRGGQHRPCEAVQEIE